MSKTLQDVLFDARALSESLELGLIEGHGGGKKLAQILEDLESVLETEPATVTSRLDQARAFNRHIAALKEEDHW